MATEARGEVPGASLCLHVDVLMLFAASSDAQGWECLREVALLLLDFASAE